jgi:hypothetical protein
VERRRNVSGGALARLTGRGGSVAEQRPRRTAGDTNEFYQAALKLRALGISCIPIQAGTKEPPIGFRWGVYAHRLPDASEMYQWFVTEGRHIAVVPGVISNWLAILDYDGLGGYEWHAAQYPHIQAYPRVRTGSGKVHLWVRTDRPTAYYKKELGDGSMLEVRANVHYTLCPPSIHPNGKPYVWEVEPW